jgi:hypothetical protein
MGRVLLKLLDDQSFRFVFFYFLPVNSVFDFNYCLSFVLPFLNNFPLSFFLVTKGYCDEPTRSLSISLLSLCVFTTGCDTHTLHVHCIILQLMSLLRRRG